MPVPSGTSGAAPEAQRESRRRCRAWETSSATSPRERTAQPHAGPTSRPATSAGTATSAIAAAARASGSFILAEEHDRPDDREIHEAEEHGGAAEVLRALGERVVLERDAVDRGLERGVEQLHHQHEQH